MITFAIILSATKYFSINLTVLSAEPHKYVSLVTLANLAALLSCLKILSSVPHAIISHRSIVPDPQSPASLSAKYNFFLEDFNTLVFHYHHYESNSRLL
jgi:hypothetical protein